MNENFDSYWAIPEPATEPEPAVEAEPAVEPVPEQVIRDKKLTKVSDYEQAYEKSIYEASKKQPTYINGQKVKTPAYSTAQKKETTYLNGEKTRQPVRETYAASEQRTSGESYAASEQRTSGESYAASEQRTAKTSYARTERQSGTKTTQSVRRDGAAHGRAATALVFGILSIAFSTFGTAFGIGGFLPLIFAVVAMRNADAAKRTAQQDSEEWKMAKTAKILGSIGLTVTIVLSFLGGIIGWQLVDF